MQVDGDCKGGMESLFEMALIKNRCCALWLEPSMVDFVMYLLPDCDSFKSALPLSFEQAVHVNASLFYIMLSFLTTSLSRSVQNRSLNKSPSNSRILPQVGYVIIVGDLIHRSSRPLACIGFSSWRHTENELSKGYLGGWSSRTTFNPLRNHTPILAQSSKHWIFKDICITWRGKGRWTFHLHSTLRQTKVTLVLFFPPWAPWGAEILAILLWLWVNTCKVL